MLEATNLAVALPNLAEKRSFSAAPLVTILQGLNIDVAKGECLGIVGESGSGKTTLGRTLVRLYKPTAGTIRFDGTDITTLEEKHLRPMRANMQMIFQEPQASLNPRRRVRDAVLQPLRTNGHSFQGINATEKASELLDTVGLDPVLQRRFPHELSGGQQQRVCIARAISLRPSLVVADEIVSGLDVSNQAQILLLLNELRRDLGLAVVFISHDLSVVRTVCDRATVLLNGRQIETGRTERIFENPRRRYTSTLIQSVPLPEVDQNWLNVTENETTEFNREKAMNISGCVALVTGSNRGIGRCLVKALVDQGAKKVYASSRDPSAVEDLVSLYPGIVQSVVLDITDGSSVAQAALSCNDVEVLINNAGVNRTRGLIAASDLDSAREEMETNYFGTLSMCRAFAPVLKTNGGGCIVNLLSILSRVALPLMGSLCASKAAALRLTEGVRAELSAQNTLVIAVMPGAVDTDMSKDFPPPKMPPEEVAQAALEAIKTGTEESYPGEMASGLSQGLATDPKGVEKELAAYLPG